MAMERWTGAIALVLVVGLLAAILGLLIGLGGGGIRLQLAGPIVIEGTSGPQELKVLLTVPDGIKIEAGGEAQASLRTTLEGIPCSHCGDGVMVPVRWNPFTGDITWRCTSCGYTLEEHRE